MASLFALSALYEGLNLAMSRAVLSDEKVYPNLSIFDPDRFMKDGALDPSVRDPEAAFGYGRRIW